jgi:hypothetical protein
MFVMRHPEGLERGFVVCASGLLEVIQHVLESERQRKKPRNTVQTAQ